jgi:hypothetical protein
MGFLPRVLSAIGVRNLLQSLSGTNRLDASAIKNLPSGSGGGDMVRSVYDTDDNGVVDNAAALNGQAASYYLDRINHTGSQSSTSISDFFEAVDDRIAALLVAGSGIGITYNDIGNALTISNTGSGIGSASSWQLISANYTIAPGDKIAVNCTNPITIQLPANPPNGSEFEIVKYTGNSIVTIDPNGSAFEGNAVGGNLFYSSASATTDTTDKLIYINNTIGWISTRKRVNPLISLAFSSAGDTNGLIYYLGTNASNGTFVNPSTSGTIGVLASSSGGGTPALTINRTSDEWFTGNIAGSWIAWNLNSPNKMSVTSYVLRNRSTSTTASLRNWILEGTNSVSIFDIAGVNAASWTPIDTRNNDATFNALSQYYPIVANGSASRFQYLRLRNTGVNSSGTNELCLNEIEFYGSLLTV